MKTATDRAIFRTFFGVSEGNGVLRGIGTISAGVVRAFY